MNYSQLLNNNGSITPKSMSDRENILPPSLHTNGRFFFLSDIDILTSSLIKNKEGAFRFVEHDASYK